MDFIKDAVKVQACTLRILMMKLTINFGIWMIGLDGMSLSNTYKNVA